MATIIFKATEACNACCVYCDVVHLKKPVTISYELLECVYKRVDEYLRQNPEETVKITWHGGEPCMAGKDFFRKALQLQKEYCANTGNRVKYLIQSNLTLLDDEFIEIFLDMGIRSIGTSYECIPGIRGIGPDRDTFLYNRKFFRGVNLLEKHGISWGFIYVVTKNVIDKPEDVFYHLTNLKPQGNFVFHPVVTSAHSADESRASVVTAEQYVDFLGAVFRLWWPHRNRYPRVQPFARYLSAYKGESFLVNCDTAEDCGPHVYIGPDGALSQCGRSADWSLLDYGNIVNMSLDEIFKHPVRRPLYNRKDVLMTTDCSECEYWSLCHGGCPLDAYNAYGDFTRKSGLCDTVRLFLKNYFEPITGLLFPGYN